MTLELSFHHNAFNTFSGQPQNKSLLYSPLADRQVGDHWRECSAKKSELFKVKKKFT
jgi:hypothetical protein